MKMTDADSAKDLCRRFDELTNSPSGGSQEDWSEWQCDADAQLRHLAARLAADQQKGGGELCPDCGDRVDPNPDENGETRCADCWITHRRATSPQPSIPAPAQQDSKASGGVVVPFGHMLLDKHGNCVDFRRYTDDGQYVFDAAEVYHRDACVDEQIGPHSAVLVYAHPPHADQETQG